MNRHKCHDFGLNILRLLAAQVVILLFFMSHGTSVHAQSTSGQIYLPSIMTRAGDEAHAEQNYDFDYASQSDIDQLGRTIAEIGLLVVREDNVLTFYYESGEQRQSVVQLTCTGVGCGRQDTMQSSEAIGAASVADSQAFRARIRIKGESRAIVEKINNRKVLLTFLKISGDETYEFWCRRCKISVDIPNELIAPDPNDTPTMTPEPSATPDPSATPEPTATQSPLTSTSPCPTHNPDEWHPHYDSSRNCWYDHVHGENPSLIAYRFGEPWAFLQDYSAFDANDPAWQISTVSYPWQTPNENTYKHGGYKWILSDVSPQNGVMRVEPHDVSYNWITDGPYWGTSTAFRYEEHFGGAFKADDMLMFGEQVRIHSFWLEMYVDDGGIIRGGGHWDTGRFQQYQTEIVPLPSDPDPISPRQLSIGIADPYRGHSDLCETYAGGKITALWTSRPVWDPREGFTGYDYGYNAHMGLFSVHKDYPVCMDRNGTSHFLCPDGQCEHNNTEYGAFRIWAYVSPALDGSPVDKDARSGWVTVNTFTDVYGNVAPNCTKPDPNCVPYTVEKVRPGWYGWETHVDNQADVVSRDYDESPPGKFYINIRGN